MKIFKILQISSVVLLLATSCDLNEYPSSFVTSGHFYRNREQCVAALNSCYTPLNNIFKAEYLQATESTADLMWVANSIQDCQAAMSPTNPLWGEQMWTQGYKGVVNCNAAIEGIRNSPMPEEEKIQLIGEGIVMRAYYYYLLTATFNDVPFYTDDVADEATLERIAKLGRMPAAKTREYLIGELQEYVPQMVQRRTCNEPDNRSGAAMGWMMIAKLGVWNEDWESARDACLELVKLYGDLSLYPYSDVMFRNKNTPESIFEVQHTYDATGIQKTTTVAAICTPTRQGTNDGYTYDGVVITELGNQMTTWTSNRPNAYFYQALQTAESGDIRFKYNLATEYNGVKFTSNVPWLGPKFWCPGMRQTADGNNMKVFRYADALLLLAESYLRLGEYELAVVEMNKVKARAEIPLYTFSTPDELFEELTKERARELFGEFNRKYDLVRWGIWYTQTYDYTGYATLRDNLVPCREYYPIPDTEVIRSGYNLDNKEYNKWGL